MESKTEAVAQSTTETVVQPTTEPAALTGSDYQWLWEQVLSGPVPFALGLVIAAIFMSFVCQQISKGKAEQLKGKDEQCKFKDEQLKAKDDSAAALKTTYDVWVRQLQDQIASRDKKQEVTETTIQKIWQHIQEDPKTAAQQPVIMNLVSTAQEQAAEVRQANTNIQSTLADFAGFFADYSHANHDFLGPDLTSPSTGGKSDDKD